MSIFLKNPGSRIMVAALLLAILTIMVPAVPASAVPPAPHQFYGNVFVGGVAPSSGTIIAKINGVQYATGTIDSLGRYGYSTPLFKVPADNPDTADKEGGVPGDTVQFFVGGIQAYQTCAFQSGGSTNLDLTVPGTPTSPAVTTVAANPIASTTVTLNGNLTATGSQVPLNVYFRYGITTAYGMATAPVSISSTGQFAAYVSGLTPDTTYNFIAVAEGSRNVSGTNLTFKTLASSVTVSTVAATNVGTNAATLNGNLTSLGGTGAVEVYFRYGTNGTTWPYTTPRQGMSAIGTFSYPINALSYNAKYYFQAVAVFGGNSVTGSILNFTTLPQGGSTAVNRFYGTVYVNGLATSSATVVAYLNGAATTPASTTTSAAQGQYGYSPLFNVYGGPGTVTFRVNNVLVPQTASWTSGGVTQLDLYATPGVLTAATGSASWASATTATLNATLSALGPTDNSTLLYIDWGTTSGSYANHTAGIPATATVPTSYYITASPLSDGVTYYYKARVIGNGSGTVTAPTEGSYTHHTVAPTLVITTADPLPAGTTGTPYTGVTFAATGGIGALTWTQTSGSLPGGLGPLTSGGVLSGTPTADGTFTFNIHVTDGTNSNDKTFHITIGSTPPPESEAIGSTAGSSSTTVMPSVFYLWRFQANSTTNITKINLKSTGSANAKAAIYSDNSGSVGTLIAANQSVNAISAGINPITITSTPITQNEYYWLAFWTDATSITYYMGSGRYAFCATAAPFTFPDVLTGFIYGTGPTALISGSN